MAEQLLHVEPLEDEEGPLGKSVKTMARDSPLSEYLKGDPFEGCEDVAQDQPRVGREEGGDPASKDCLNEWVDDFARRPSLQNEEVPSDSKRPVFPGIGDRAPCTFGRMSPTDSTGSTSASVWAESSCSSSSPSGRLSEGLKSLAPGSLRPSTATFTSPSETFSSEADLQADCSSVETGDFSRSPPQCEQRARGASVTRAQQPVPPREIDLPLPQWPALAKLNAVRGQYISARTSLGCGRRFEDLLGRPPPPVAAERPSSNPCSKRPPRDREELRRHSMEGHFLQACLGPVRADLVAKPLPRK